MEIDVQALINLISPILLRMPKFSEKAVDGLIHKIGADGWDLSKDLSKKAFTLLHPRIDNDPEVKEAVQLFVDEPNSKASKALLGKQLKKILENDESLARELALLIRSDSDMHKTISTIEVDTIKSSGNHNPVQVGTGNISNISIGQGRDITIQTLPKESLNSNEKGEGLNPFHNILLEKLRRFEGTDRYRELLENPKNYGSTSTVESLKVYVVGLGADIVFLFTVVSNLITSKIIFFVIFGIVFLIFSLAGAVFLISKIVQCYREISQGKRLIYTQKILAVAVFVINLYRENNQLRTVLFQDSYNNRYYANPHSSYDGSTLCEGDLGVVYLQKGNKIQDHNTEYVILGFELASRFE